MKQILFAVFCLISCFNSLTAQTNQTIISKADLVFLEGIMKAVMDSSRIYPGQKLVDPFGVNNTGGILIRPGGRDTYPAFWIRDYAMSLETGFVTREEQKHMLLLTASTQCDQTWITKGGSMVPFGAIADHIRVDNSLPVYFPGTYDYEGQGTEEFGMTPPYDDPFYFIHMANYYINSTKDLKILQQVINGSRLVDRLEIAFKIPPSREESHIVYTNDKFRGVDFGFRDAIYITGDLSYTSILKYRAALQLAAIFDQLKKKDKAATYRNIALQIKKAIPPLFKNSDGMLMASTGKSGQPDVWATAFAIYLDLLDGNEVLKASQHLANAYIEGKLAYKGSIRHIIKGEDFSAGTAWESAIVSNNNYQNGAYWGTATGWVSYAIAKTNNKMAARLIEEYISELKESDFRKGSNFHGPYECFYPPDYSRGPVYLTTVSVPYIVLKSKFK